MARPRLILPASLRGPLRVTPDLPEVRGNTRPRRGGKLGLLLLWSGLCAGLYLIGNLPRGRSIPAPTGNSTTNQPSTNRYATVPSDRADKGATPPVMPLSVASPERRTPPPAPTELKPVRDKSNLAVFGTGLERPADLGGTDFGAADLTSPDLASPDPGHRADPASSDDQNSAAQRHLVE
jgi:hypothetical protein